MKPTHADRCGTADCQCYRDGRAEQLGDLIIKAIQMEEKWGIEPPWQAVVHLEWPTPAPTRKILEHSLDLIAAHPEWGHTFTQAERDLLLSQCDEDGEGL